MKKSLTQAVRAAEDKKAEDIVILNLSSICSFTDHFLICTGHSSRQVQAIVDGIDEKLRTQSLRPAHIEGYSQGEWVLMDYTDFVVHVFSPKAREFYDLERLWRGARRVDVPAAHHRGTSRKQG
ncbi:MAG: ribosome silencing factor [Acidobacteriia bacterium]|nr:ribosome silencing factor [Terriglobia bacterium]